MLSSRPLKLTFLGMALLVPAILGGCDRQSGEGAQQQAESPAGGTVGSGKLDTSHRGEPVPDMSLADASGEKLALTSLRGQPLLVNLWATWCAPCVTELPMLNTLAGREDLNIKVLTVSQDMGEPDKVQAFLAERGLDRLPALLDPEGDLAFHYQTGVLPTTILYDAQGKEVWRYVGAHDWLGAQGQELLAQASGN